MEQRAGGEPQKLRVGQRPVLDRAGAGRENMGAVKCRSEGSGGEKDPLPRSRSYRGGGVESEAALSVGLWAGLQDE